MLDLQPHLTGKLLKLRPLQVSDFENLYAVSSDPLVWEQHPAKTRYQRSVFEDFFKVAIESKGTLIALDSSTGEVLGSSRYYDFDAGRKLVKIGYTFLARKCWGKKFNLEMKQLMLRHAFQHVDRVLFEVGVNNMRSRTAMERIGGKLSEEFKPNALSGTLNALGVHVTYEIQASEFSA